MAQSGVGRSVRGQSPPTPLISHCGAGHLRPVHERQSADDHHHHLGPLRQAQDVAAGQTAQVPVSGLVYLPAVWLQQLRTDENLLKLTAVQLLNS